jgi:hypothetical protein
MELKHPLCLVVCLTLLGSINTTASTGRCNRFTKEEDVRLSELVDEYLTHVGAQIDWQVVAGNMPGRNRRQCRERYKNYINPAFGKEPPWTLDEIIYAQQNFCTPKKLIQLDMMRKFGYWRSVGAIHKYSRRSSPPSIEEISPSHSIDDIATMDVGNLIIGAVELEPPVIPEMTIEPVIPVSPEVQISPARIPSPGRYTPPLRHFFSPTQSPYQSDTDVSSFQYYNPKPDDDDFGSGDAW